jgi:hypothetical protein
MPGSTNDSRVLRRSSLYRLAMAQTLFDGHDSMEGFSPYLLGDSGYPLLPWLMVLHKNVRNLSALETLFNRKLRKGKSIVENAFGILKQTFRELLVKSELDIVFLPDMITCCAILHNVLLRQSHRFSGVRALRVMSLMMMANLQKMILETLSTALLCRAQRSAAGSLST